MTSWSRTMRVALRGRPSRADHPDEGFALVMVVGTMAVLMLLVLAATAFAAQNVPTSRRAQDYAAAMAAAQAGVDDFLSRLNTCDTHWASPCPGSPEEKARSDDPAAPKWARVPGTSGAKAPQYTYAVVSNPTTTPGLIRVLSQGRVLTRTAADGTKTWVTRRIVVDLRKDGFLQFIYYTDKESLAPALMRSIWGAGLPASSTTVNYAFNGGTAYKETYSGLDDTAVQACARYYYSVPPATGARSAPTQTKTVYWTKAGVEQAPVSSQVAISGGPSCDINFVGGDVINGPMYTKDAMLLSPRSGKNPLFKGTVETYWQTSYSPAAPASAPYRQNSGGVPDPAGFAPTIATRLLELPPTNGSIRSAAVTGSGQGCLYQGPTRITLRNDGKMLVENATMTAAANPGCGPSTSSTDWLSLPKNGVVYVDPTTATCPGNGKSLQTYPVADDITTYDCRAGDAFVSGTLKGQLTIATAGDVVVTDDLVYSRQVWNGTKIDPTVTDVLGLVAQGWVKTYHPVTSSNAELAQAQIKDLQIDAAILSVDNSFTVQWFNRGTSSGLGTLKVRGGIYQRYRGPVGTSGGQGYLKDYVYDTRLVSLPPPYFLEPTSAPWKVVGLSEQRAGS